MKKKAIIRFSVLAMMSVAFCSFTFSGTKQNTKKAAPLYHSVDCMYINIETGVGQPGVKCVYGQGISCLGSTECAPKPGDPGPR